MKKLFIITIGILFLSCGIGNSKEVDLGIVSSKEPHEKAEPLTGEQIISQSSEEGRVLTCGSNKFLFEEKTFLYRRGENEERKSYVFDRLYYPANKKTAILINTETRDLTILDICEGKEIFTFNLGDEPCIDIYTDSEGLFYIESPIGSSASESELWEIEIEMDRLMVIDIGVEELGAEKLYLWE